MVISVQSSGLPEGFGICEVIDIVTKYGVYSIERGSSQYGGSDTEVLLTMESHQVYNSETFSSEQKEYTTLENISSKNNITVDEFINSITMVFIHGESEHILDTNKISAIGTWNAVTFDEIRHIYDDDVPIINVRSQLEIAKYD